jgi:hypothetical protein
MLAFAFLVMAGVVGLVCVRWATRPAHGSIQDRAERLQAGMSVDEIADILGEYGRFHEFGDGDMQVVWQEKRFTLCVTFKPLVTGAASAHLIELGPGDTQKITTLFGGSSAIWDRIRRWLRL